MSTSPAWLRSRRRHERAFLILRAEREGELVPDSDDGLSNLTKIGSDPLRRPEPITKSKGTSKEPFRQQCNLTTGPPQVKPPCLVA